MRVVIYGLVDPRSGVLRYIGQTRDRQRRYSRHCHPHPKDRRHRAQWIRALTRGGLKPEFVEIEVCDPFNVDAAERFWIASLRAAGAELLNIADGGGVTRRQPGFKLTPEHRNKISASHKGIKHTPETRAKMSAQRTGLRQSDQTIARRQKTLDALKYAHTPEVRKRIAEAARQQWSTRPRKLLHPLKITHGTAVGYLRGCRCLSCKTAKSAAHRRERYGE